MHHFLLGQSLPAPSRRHSLPARPDCLRVAPHQSLLPRARLPFLLGFGGEGRENKEEKTLCLLAARRWEAVLWRRRGYIKKKNIMAAEHDLSGFGGTVEVEVREIYQFSSTTSHNLVGFFCSNKMLCAEKTTKATTGAAIPGISSG